MKSISIIVSLCSLLVIISGFAMSRQPIRATNQTLQCQTSSSQSQIKLKPAKKSKLSVMPRWHQVIPGMFH